MAYDADLALEALDPPVFVHEGRNYKGRHASIFEWYRYAGAVEKLGKNQLNVVQVVALYKRLCNLWFPPPRRPWWKLVGKGEPSVADLLLTLPLPVQTDAIKSFMNSQVRALGLMMPQAWGKKRPSRRKTQKGAT